MTVICKCQFCSKDIEFDADGLEEGKPHLVKCPYCDLETTVYVPKATRLGTPKPPLLENISNLTIGDIAVSGGKIITPNGIGNLYQSQWIFSDMSRVESRIPAAAIVLAIVFALLCLIGLLFLLMREDRIVGYAEVSVHSGTLFHKVQIPVKSQHDVGNIRNLVNKAQSLAMLAKP